MKAKWNLILALLVFLAVTLTLTACGGDEEEDRTGDACQLACDKLNECFPIIYSALYKNDGACVSECTSDDGEDGEDGEDVSDNDDDEDDGDEACAVCIFEADCDAMTTCLENAGCFE